MEYPYAHLRDRLDKCTAIFGGGACEIAPPFLPALALDIFEWPIRRIYLSATLNYKTDIAPAFGCMPDKAIELKIDVGNFENTARPFVARMDCTDALAAAVSAVYSNQIAKNPENDTRMMQVLVLMISSAISAT